jgi:hypothetical protein
MPWPKGRRLTDEHRAKIGRPGQVRAPMPLEARARQAATARANNAKQRMSIEPCRDEDGNIIKVIPLTCGKVALVESDYEWLMQWKWEYNQTTGIAIRRDFSQGRAKPICIAMHRLIMNAPAELVVDHINHNRLDNQRSNLRLATVAENCRNQMAYKNSRSTSQYKGVYWHKCSRKWHARIKVNYKDIYLGGFTDEHAAALAYDRAARQHHGEFACLNFPYVEHTNDC